jgi:predicted permease
MPPRFHGAERFFSPDLWLPIAMQAQIESGNDWLERRGTHNVFIVGRLANGVTHAQAESALNLVATQLGREHPALNEGMRIILSPPGLAGNMLRGPVIGFAAALLVVAALVLLLTCANLAGLLLARVADQQLDRAIRLALGATKWDLVRRALVESALLSAGGAVVALALASAMARALTTWRPPLDFPLAAAIDLDVRVVGFALALGVLATFLVGFVPAAHGRRTDVAGALKDDQPRLAFGWHTRDVIIGLQVALSLVLLVGSLLIVRSLQRATVMDFGFNPSNAVSLSVDLGLQGYDGDRGRAFAPGVVERVAALPGIDSAAIANSLPLSLDTSTHRVYIEGRPDPRASDVRSAIYYQVTPGFFRTMQIRLIAGRDFTTWDTAKSPRVAIVNQAFARLLSDVDPVGKRFRTGDWIEIVGLVQTGKYESLTEADKPVAFHPLSQWYNPTTTIVARSSLDAGRTLDFVRRAVPRRGPGPCHLR